MNLQNTLFGTALATFFISMVPVWSCAEPFPSEQQMGCLSGWPSQFPLSETWCQSPLSLFLSAKFLLGCVGKARGWTIWSPVWRTVPLKSPMSCIDMPFGASLFWLQSLFPHWSMDRFPGCRYAGHASETRLSRHRSRRCNSWNHCRLCHLWRWSSDLFLIYYIKYSPSRYNCTTVSRRARFLSLLLHVFTRAALDCLPQHLLQLCLWPYKLTFGQCLKIIRKST